MTHVLERRGSSKDIWKVLGQDGQVEKVRFIFSDRVSVFDIGPIPILFCGLGRLRCAIAGKVFQALNSARISNHYISHEVETASMYVVPANIPTLNISYGDNALCNLMPVELLCRLALTKEFMSRVERNEISRQAVERLMEVNEFQEGARLTPGFVECSTKFEEADRYLSDSEAAILIGTSELNLRSYYNIVQDVFAFLYRFFRSNGGFLLKSGKLEGALASDGYLMFADSISPDELRLIGPDGRSHDKDPVREWYDKTFPEWKQELLVAKKAFPGDKAKWPTYPDVPPKSVIEDMVERYEMVADGIGAI